MKSAPIEERMGKIEAHSQRIKMMASYLHHLVTNRCTNALNQIEQIRKKIWVIFKFLLQILACIIKSHYKIDYLCTKKYILKKKMAEKVAAKGNWTPISWLTGQGLNHYTRWSVMKPKKKSEVLDIDLFVLGGKFKF